MRRRLRLGDYLVDLRLALEGALDRFLHRPVIEVEDLLVVLGFPVDEHPHQDAVVVHLAPRDDARGDAVDHRTRDRRLRRAEHLHGLRGVLDGDLVEQECVGFRRQVRRDDGEQLGETVGVVRQRADESMSRVARLRPDDQIDVGDLIPVAYQRLANEEIRCHNYLPIRMGPRVSLAGRHECGVDSSVARGGVESHAVPRLRVAPTEPYRWGANLPAAPTGVKPASRGRKMELWSGLGRWCLARGDPPYLVRAPLLPLLRVVELRGRHLFRPAGDLSRVAEQVVQDLPQRPVLATLGARLRAHAVWIPRARSSAVLNSPAAARTVEASPRSAR